MFDINKLFKYYEKVFGIEPGYHFKNGVRSLSHKEKRQVWKSMIHKLRRDSGER